TVSIKAINSVGQSTAKNLVFTIAAPVIPATPTRLSVIPLSTSQIRLTWNYVLGATSYDVLQDGAVVASVTPPYTHSSLTANSVHTYAVRAKNSAGTSAYTTTISAPTQSAVGSVIPLYGTGTTLEVESVTDTPTAIVTRVGDRARDRHARENMFNAYDHYLTWYWEARTADIEVVDHVAKGGSDVVFNYTTQWPLSAPEFRAYFLGVGTVAQYYANISATRLPNPDHCHYTAKVTTNNKESRAIQAGDRIEIEVSQFLASPIHGRPNYYGTAILYVVGEGGFVPWEGVGQYRDSFPMSEKGWLGGRTTLPYQQSDEPRDHFKQTANNISPWDIQPFMLGRRVHHTDFGDGSHAEAGNPIFPEQVGKLGPRFTGRSCFACHTENGRALPPLTGAAMLKSVVRVGSDATGTSLASIGKTLQQLNTSGAPEAGVSIASWTTVNGTYGDGTAYSLRKPVYAFTGVTPPFYSVRLAPQIVGEGLLEAIPEGEIAAIADPNDTNADGISGRMQTVTDPQTGELRMGRFGWKGGQATLKQQLASALNNDVGVTTSIFQNLDRGSSQSDPGPSTELNDTDLDNLYRYNALLGVSARRSLTDAQALHGETLFASASCIKCHTATLTTSAYHPLTELRSQTIHPYSDMLLHDMGTELADNMGEAVATGAEWRTTPLWSIGLSDGVSSGEAYLHDGRARTIEEAILWHGGESQASKEAFRTMSAADRADLVKFLESL
ncbi:MAG: di-heme oxidoredictase family protein, partial [Chthoniobacterales bacterium]